MQFINRIKSYTIIYGNNSSKFYLFLRTDVWVKKKKIFENCNQSDEYLRKPNMMRFAN